MKPDDRHEIAVHEAGHFVAAYYLGVSLASSITIKPHGDTLGEVGGEGGDWNDPKEAYAKVVELLAGYRAQKRIASLGSSLRGAGYDLGLVLRILRWLPVGGRLRAFFDARREADDLLTAHWDQVLGIAGLLLEQGTVGEAAHVWLDYANDKMSAEDCVRHLAILGHYGNRVAASGTAVTHPDDQWRSYIQAAKTRCQCQ
jgi:hypothetical protein